MLATALPGFDNRSETTRDDEEFLAFLVRMFGRAEIDAAVLPLAILAAVAERLTLALRGEAFNDFTVTDLIAPTEFFPAPDRGLLCAVVVRAEAAFFVADFTDTDLAVDSFLASVVRVEDALPVARVDGLLTAVFRNDGVRDVARAGLPAVPLVDERTNDEAGFTLADAEVFCFTKGTDADFGFFFLADTW